MIPENNARVIYKDLSNLELCKLGRYVILKNGQRMFMKYSETFSIFNEGKLSFEIKSSSENPYVLVNIECPLFPLEWPQEWGIVHVGTSYMEEVYQRTQFNK